jgi:DNA invertase Pin-like site-specific DNA recombinase
MLMLSVLASVAEFERNLMLERQREGIAKAKAEGKYRGRPAEIDHTAVCRMRDEGVYPAEIARRLRIARSSVYRLFDLARSAKKS